MKLAYPVGTPDTRKAVLGCQGDPAEVLPALREIGYDGVELFVRDPRAMDVDRLLSLLKTNRLDVPVVGTGPLVSDDGLTFTAVDPAVRRAAVERVESVVELAANFGAQVNVGKLRGDLRDGMRDKSWGWMEEGFSRLCQTADRHGVQITVEPQTRSVINNLNTSQEALAWVKALHHPNLYLMLDVFHMDREEPSIAEGICRTKGAFLHVHFADRRRGVPGTGGIDFHEALVVLKSIGYDRYITMEIEQYPDSLAAARAAYEFVSNAMREVGV